MARQLVFTSAPQGLTPGRTGYCTVARHGDLRERLVPMLERLSAYPSEWQPQPVICSFRMVEIAGTRFPVLSRIVDAGHDYTHRNTYLAHHLILDLQEMETSPAPAEVFLRWEGWLNQWKGPPRWLEEGDLVNLTKLPTVLGPALPALAWRNFTGDAGSAALLLDDTQASSRVLRCPTAREGEILDLLRESTALLPAAERWRTEFTTCLQPTESATLFRWTTVRADSPVDAAATRGGNVLDLTRPDALPPVPTNDAARRARGEAKTSPLAGAAHPARNSSSGSPLGPGGKNPAGGPNLPAPPTAAKGMNPWMLGAAALIVVGVLAAVILMWPTPAPLAPLAATPLPPPRLTVPAPTPVRMPTNTISLVNEQALVDISNLANDGKYLAALTKWQELAAAAPDFIQTRSDLLRNQLLPGARREWLATLDKIAAQLGNPAAARADLSNQLGVLQKLVHAWPFPNPDEMDRAAKSVADKIQFLGQLPDAPVWIVDSLAITAKGADYEDASGIVSIPELDALLGSQGGKFGVSAAAATSLTVPAPGQWFKFSVQTDDFEKNNYLILHDATRGKAGGLFLQLLDEAPGKTRLIWRLFAPDSDFVRNNPANAPLGPVSRELWLRFAGEPPLPTFYLLLRRPDVSSVKPWTSIDVPKDWLAVSGAPAKVTLPSWLGNNLLWHAAAGQTFRLAPAAPGMPAADLAEMNPKPVVTSAEARYDASDLVALLHTRIRESETNLYRAQMDLQELQQAMNNSSGPRPSQGAIDQATANLKTIQNDLDRAQAAAQAAAQPGWPAAAAPWTLTATLATKDTLTLLRFSR